MELFFVMAVFFIFVTLIFVIFCFFFPEWVGITGKKALEVIEHQKESTNPVDGQGSGDGAGASVDPRTHDEKP